MAAATWTVIGLRLPVIWAAAAAPTRRRQLEIRRMHLEKALAASEAALSAQFSFQQSVLRAWGEYWISGRHFDWPAAALKAMSAAMAPPRRMVLANARRLQQRKGV